MGGWVTQIGNVSNFEERKNRFEKIFSVESVPQLRMEIKTQPVNTGTIMWAWNNHRIPDIYTKVSENGVFQTGEIPLNLLKIYNYD